MKDGPGDRRSSAEMRAPFAQVIILLEFFVLLVLLCGQVVVDTLSSF